MCPHSAIALRRVRWEIGDLYFVFFITTVGWHPLPLGGASDALGRLGSTTLRLLGFSSNLKKTSRVVPHTRDSVRCVGPLAPSPTL